MLHFMMTNQYFYYGIIAAGVLGLLSTVLTGLYYRMIVRDLKRVRKPKGKWMRSFINELDNRKMLAAEYAECGCLYPQPPGFRKAVSHICGISA